MDNKELNLKEMEQAAGGVCVDRFNAKELIAFGRLTQAMSDFEGTDKFEEALNAYNAFLDEMETKYGKEALRVKKLQGRIFC